MRKLRILYTTEEGGLLKFAGVRRHEPGSEFDVMEEFERIKSGRRVILDPSKDVLEYVEPAYVELLEIVDGYDFLLDRPRLGWER